MNGTYITVNLLRTISVWGRVYGVCVCAIACMCVCFYVIFIYFIIVGFN